MNNIYLIEFDKVDYDQYCGYVVIAENEFEAEQLCKITIEKGYDDSRYRSNIETFKIVGVSDLKPQVILSSFRAG